MFKLFSCKPTYTLKDSLQKRYNIGQKKALQQKVIIEQSHI